MNVAVAREEGDFAMEHAREDPYNESPWRYLIGILKEQQRVVQAKDDLHSLLLEYEARARDLEGVLTKANRNPDACVNRTSARVDLLEMIGTKESVTTAIALAEGLANKHDVVRTKYWSLVLERLRQKEKLTTDNI